MGTMLKTWFHFYASFKPKGKLCLRKPTSFLNDLEIKNELCSKGSFHGLTSSKLKKVCSKWLPLTGDFPTWSPVVGTFPQSFIESWHNGRICFIFLTSLTWKMNCAQGQFYFLTSLKPRINPAQRWPVSFLHKLET